MKNECLYIADLANQYDTPMYIFDETQLRERISKIKGILGEYNLCFSIKSNPFLLPSVVDCVDKIEVCSPGELEICKKYRIDPDKIIYSGVVRKIGEIRKALDYGVKKYTVESVHQFELLSRECTNDVYVYIRLNSGAQFGMSEIDAENVLSCSKKHKNISIVGIHYFAGTQRRNKGFIKQKQELEYVCDYIKTVNRNGYNISELEYGPGLPVALFEGDCEEDNYEYISTIMEYLDGIDTELNITIEMGRYISAYCGVYVTKILDVKHIQNANYCLTDGGINHLTYTGQVMGMKRPKIQHIKSNLDQGDIQDYFICGALCTTGDVLARTVTLDSPAVDDLLVFENAGAYSVCEGISLFLSRPLPLVLLRDESKNIKLLRPSFDISWLNSCKGEYDE